MALSSEGQSSFSSFSFSKLNRENYKAWKFNVDLFLLTQDLSEFTSDKKTAASIAGDDVKAAAQFKSKERKALAIICLSVEEDLKDLLHEATTPFSAWELLKNTFEPSSRARIAALRRQFMNIKFDSSKTMSDYISKILNAASELKNAGKEIADDEIAFQIMENLPESYEGLVVQLYRLQDSEFKVDAIRKQLLAEYDRQKCKPIATVSSQVMMSVKQEGSKQKVVDRRCFQCGQFGHIKRDCVFFNKSKNFKYRQNKSTFQSKNKLNSKPACRDDKQVHFAAALMSENPDVEFVLDSAATHHFCADRQMFQNIKNYHGTAATAEGTTKILGVGDIVLEINSGTVTRTLM